MATLLAKPGPAWRNRCKEADRKGKVCSILRTGTGIALLSLLTSTTPLEAQSTQLVDSELQRFHRPTEVRNQSTIPTPETAGTFAVPVTQDDRPAPDAGCVDPPTQDAISQPRGISLCTSSLATPSRQSASLVAYTQPMREGDKAADNSTPSSVIASRQPKPADFGRSIYYKNKLEFGLDVGWLPINIPFVYDVFVGDSYNMTPLKYTMMPIIASLRWQTGDIGGPWILRGNFDLTFSGSVTVIPRGPETRYFAFIFGVRRNFVPRHGRIAPYFDQRGGIGNIDAKEPLGVTWAQGQDLTFTYNMGAGFRYNFNPHYSISAGVNYMHVSNGYLSEPKYTNYGINVYGPMFGLDVRLGKPHRTAAQ